MNKPRNSELTTHVRTYGKFGELIDKCKVKSSEKQKSALMIDRLMELHNVTDLDIVKAKAEAMVDEKKMQPEWRKPIIWKRDERGNII